MCFQKKYDIKVLKRVPPLFKRSNTYFAERKNVSYKKS